MKISHLGAEYELVPKDHDDPALSDCEAMVQDRKIYYDRNLKGREWYHAIMHELWHVVYPEKPEPVVHAEAALMTEALWWNNMIQEPDNV